MTPQVPMAILLTGLGRDVTARVRRAVRPSGLGAQQYDDLMQHQAFGAAIQADLADPLGCGRGNFPSIAAELCARGLVDRTWHEQGRRRYVLRLSVAGQELLRHTADASAAAEEELLAPLDPAQREQLYALLRV